MVLKGSSEQNNNEELGEGIFVQGGAGWVKAAACGPGLASAEGEQCRGALGQHCRGVLWPWCCSPHVQGFTCLPHPTLCHPGPHAPSAGVYWRAGLGVVCVGRTPCWESILGSLFLNLAVRVLAVPWEEGAWCAHGLGKSIWGTQQNRLPVWRIFFILGTVF